MSHLDRKVEHTNSEIARSLQDLVRLDQIIKFDDQNGEVLVNSLNEQLAELKRNYTDVSTKREWAEAKLQEMQSQRELFDQNDHQQSLVQ